MFVIFRFNFNCQEQDILYQEENMFPIVKLLKNQIWPQKFSRSLLLECLELNSECHLNAGMC